MSWADTVCTIHTIVCMQLSQTVHACKSRAWSHMAVHEHFVAFKPSDILCAVFALFVPKYCWCDQLHIAGKQTSEYSKQANKQVNKMMMSGRYSSLHTPQGSVSGIQMVMASSLILGCGFASTTLWWFSQRYIGELSLLGPRLLRFSVLDFWGNRQVIISDTPLEHRHNNRKCPLTDTISV